jgi:hypothetical protein
MNANEPVSATDNGVTVALIFWPFFVFFLGVLIRRVIFQSHEMKWWQELAAAIPTCLIVVPAFLATWWLAFNQIDKVPVLGYVSLLTTTGLLIEQGMVIPEFFHARFKSLKNNAKSAALPKDS